VKRGRKKMAQSAAPDTEWPFPAELLHPLEGERITLRYNLKKNTTRLVQITERVARDFSKGEEVRSALFRASGDQCSKCVGVVEMAKAACGKESPTSTLYQWTVMSANKASEETQVCILLSRDPFDEKHRCDSQQEYRPGEQESVPFPSFLAHEPQSRPQRMSVAQSVAEREVEGDVIEMPIILPAPQPSLITATGEEASRETVRWELPTTRRGRVQKGHTAQATAAAAPAPTRPPVMKRENPWRRPDRVGKQELTRRKKQARQAQPAAKKGGGGPTAMDEG